MHRRAHGPSTQAGQLPPHSGHTGLAAPATLSRPPTLLGPKPGTWLGPASSPLPGNERSHTVLGQAQGPGHTEDGPQARPGDPERGQHSHAPRPTSEHEINSDGHCSEGRPPRWVPAIPRPGVHPQPGQPETVPALTEQLPAVGRGGGPCSQPLPSLVLGPSLVQPGPDLGMPRPLYRALLVSDKAVRVSQ